MKGSQCGPGGCRGIVHPRESRGIMSRGTETTRSGAPRYCTNKAGETGLCTSHAKASAALDKKLASKRAKTSNHPEITAAEARGDSKPVSRSEFQYLASLGQIKLDRLKSNSSPAHGLDVRWGAIKSQTFIEAQKSWGGATIDAHTGQALPQGVNKYAMTIKDKGMETVSVREGASRAEFETAMNVALERFRPILEREGSHLGVFHDDDLGRIDIDPVLVVGSLDDVHTIGAATRAIGGAYNFADGNGYWPPHVKEEGE